jgi:hypothetical protein
MELRKGVRAIRLILRLRTALHTLGRDPVKLHRDQHIGILAPMTLELGEAPLHPTMNTKPSMTPQLHRLVLCALPKRQRMEADLER